MEGEIIWISVSIRSRTHDGDGLPADPEFARRIPDWQIPRD